MPAEMENDVELEIAHVLFIDTVGYSKLSIQEQRQLLDDLNKIVRTSECFRAAESTNKLIKLPTGDGMALVFSTDLEAPIRCALEISRAVRAQSGLPLRMGIHSGPVSRVVDVNDRVNIAGAGINVAQRVMSCGDAGHVLLSSRAAEDLAQYRQWQPYLHDLGDCEVKHGAKLNLVNFYNEELGNPELPTRFKADIERRTAQRTLVRRTFYRKVYWATGASLITAAAIIGFFLTKIHRSNMKVTTASGPSIAVLPFANLSDEKENAFFTDGVQDEILTDLAKVSHLKVISRTSVMEYRAGAPRNLREIAKQLGVTHVVEGSVQRAGEQVRVSAQLIDASTDAHIWAEHYDRDAADVFAIESEVAEQIVTQLRAKLSPQEKTAIESPSTTNLLAHDRYIRAKNLMATSVFLRARNNLFEAAQLLTEAVNRDPSFFVAYCDLAGAHDQIYLNGMDHTPQRLALADAAIKKAQALQPDSGQTHLILADHFYCGYLDYKKANEELAIARAKLPNDPRVWELQAYVNRRQGEWEESTRNFKQALDFDPRNFSILQNLALSYHYLRNFAQEAATEDRSLALLPKDKGARLQRAGVELKWHGNTKPLRAEIDAILAKDPQAKSDVADVWVSVSLDERDFAAAKLALAAMSAEGSHNAGFQFPRSWWEAVVARASGDLEGARAAFNAARIEVEKSIRNEPDYAEPISILAMIDAGLGRKQEAIDEARRAVELLPVTKDAINGSLALGHLAKVYAWTGEKDEACKQLAIATKLPGDISYGELRLDPEWDPLRGDPQFEKIVASLAPK